LTQLHTTHLLISQLLQFPGHHNEIGRDKMVFLQEQHSAIEVLRLTYAIKHNIDLCVRVSARDFRALLGMHYSGNPPLNIVDTLGTG